MLPTLPLSLLVIILSKGVFPLTGSIELVPLWRPPVDSFRLGVGYKPLVIVSAHLGIYVGVSIVSIVSIVTIYVGVSVVKDPPIALAAASQLELLLRLRLALKFRL